VPLWRCWLLVAGASSDRIYMGTDTRIDSILYGCLLTLLLAGPAGARWLRRLTRPAVVAVAAVALLATFLVRDAFFRDSFRYTVQGLALMALVATVCFGTVPARLMRLLESRPARHVGQLSYSLYLLHPIAVSLAERAWVPAGAGGEGGTLEAAHLAAFVATAVPLSFLLAELSYRFVETPFLRWRRRFGSHPVEGRG